MTMGGLLRSLVFFAGGLFVGVYLLGGGSSRDATAQQRALAAPVLTAQAGVALPIPSGLFAGERRDIEIFRHASQSVVHITSIVAVRVPPLSDICTRTRAISFSGKPTCSPQICSATAAPTQAPKRICGSS